MKHTRSIARRLALRLVAHASRILPRHRTNWAQAMNREIEHLPDDFAALRWAAGAVSASYLERVVSFTTVREGHTMKNFSISAALVFACVVAIEMSQILFQGAFQGILMQWFRDSLPTALVMTPDGSFAPLGMVLIVAISLPLAIIAYVLGRYLIRRIPARARIVIKLTIVTHALVLAAAIMVSLMIAQSSLDPALQPDPTVTVSLAVLWLIRVLFITVPLLLVLYVQRERLDAAALHPIA
jgi:hypothetical protein